MLTTYRQSVDLDEKEASYVTYPDEEAPPKPTTIISKGDTCTHSIHPLVVTNEDVKIELSLIEPVAKNTFFYIHECGTEEENLAQLFMRKGKKLLTADIDIDDVEDKSSFTIAAYTKSDRKHPISNILQIAVPGMYCVFFLVSYKQAISVFL